MTMFSTVAQGFVNAGVSQVFTPLFNKFGDAVCQNSEFLKEGVQKVESVVSSGGTVVGKLFEGTGTFIGKMKKNSPLILIAIVISGVVVLKIMS